MRTNTTPVPNALFDLHLKELQSTELKVLLVIIRQTLGWEDRRKVFGRKEMDWISSSQLQNKTGSSQRSISYAIEVLVIKKLIDVLDERGNLLNGPDKRKGKQRLFYRPASMLLVPVEKVSINSLNPLNSETSCANFAEDFRKKRIALTQKMRITKETLQN